MPKCIKENCAKFSSCQLERAQQSAVSKMEKTEKNSQKVKSQKIKVNILTNSNLNLKQYPMHIDTQDSAKYW